MAPKSFLMPTILVCLVLVVPGVQAGLAITVTGPDKGPEITPGESGSAEIQVSIATTGNIVCPQEAEVTIALSAGRTDDSLGLSGGMDPSSVTFTIPAGAYTDTSGQEEFGPETAALTMTVDKDKLPPNHDSHTLTAGATYDGSAVGACQGDIGPGTESSAGYDVNFPIEQLPQEEPTAPAGGGGGNGDAGGDTDTGDADTDSEESPAPGFLALSLVALAFVALRRRA